MAISVELWRGETQGARLLTIAQEARTNAGKVLGGNSFGSPTYMAVSKLSTGQQIGSIWKLGGLTPAQLANKVASRIGEDDLLGRASELAYNFLLAIFPLMLFLLALFGLFASRGNLLRSRLLLYFAEVVPPIAYDLFNKTVSELASAPGGGKLPSELPLPSGLLLGG